MEIEEDNRKYLEKKYRLIEDDERIFRKEFLDDQRNNIYQKRDFYKHITIISTAVLALSPFIIKNTKPGLSWLYAYYAYIGIIIYFLLIVFILNNLKEELDVEGNSLEEERKKFGETNKEVKLIIKKFLNSQNSIDLNEYHIELDNNTKIIQLKSDLLKLERENEERKNNPNYSSEIVVFLFTLASLFLLISFYPISWFSVYVLFVLILFATFLPFATVIGKYTSRAVHPIVKSFLKKFPK